LLPELVSISNRHALATKAGPSVLPSQGHSRLSNYPQAYLIVDAGPAAPAPLVLAKAVRRAGAACVLLQTRTGAAADAAKLRALVEAVQNSDCAALIQDDAETALELNADGIHLTHQDDPDLSERQYRAARTVLGAGRIVGVGCGLARHNAMVLAELGADYVALGGTPDHDATAQLDMVRWWAELFSVPCVAWNVADGALVAALCAADADFIASGPLGGLEPALDVLIRLSAAQETAR
jgi:thiamine-phosphate pyrophosphorylase